MEEQAIEWGRAVFRACIIIVILFLLFWPMRVSGVSMESTYYDGDVVFMNRMMAKLQYYEKGDVIIFHYNSSGEIITIMKRVVAEGGDHVQIIDGNVYVNSVCVEDTKASEVSWGNFDYIVPEGELFVLGDNKEESYDSRWFGTIPCKDVIGRVLIHIPLH